MAIGTNLLNPTLLKTLETQKKTYTIQPYLLWAVLLLAVQGIFF
jgi:hypothetical protein